MHVKSSFGCPYVVGYKNAGGVMDDPAALVRPHDKPLFKIEHVEQVADIRHIARHVVLVTTLNWIG